MIKKGAMFGLDARIALAIFGALSVISGAALYSAIKESKSIAKLSQIQEVVKAYEQFYLDTGAHVKKSTGDIINIEELVDNTEVRANWKGPYLSYKKADSRNGLQTEYDDIVTRVRINGTWGETSGVVADECISKEDCQLWIGWLGLPQNISDYIDEKIDGTLNDSEGDIRYYDWAIGKAFYIKTGISYKNI